MLTLLLPLLRPLLQGRNSASLQLGGDTRLFVFRGVRFEGLDGKEGIHYKVGDRRWKWRTKIKPYEGQTPGWQGGHPPQGGGGR